MRKTGMKLFQNIETRQAPRRGIRTIRAGRPRLRSQIDCLSIKNSVLAEAEDASVLAALEGTVAAASTESAAELRLGFPRPKVQSTTRLRVLHGGKALRTP
jgi:hypothetical protein